MKLCYFAYNVVIVVVVVVVVVVVDDDDDDDDDVDDKQKKKEKERWRRNGWTITGREQRGVWCSDLSLRREV